MSMTPERLAEIREREQEATKGPWSVSAWRVEAPGRVTILEEAPEGFTRPEDLAFAAASRTDIPDLLAAYEASQAEVERLRSAIAKHRDGVPCDMQFPFDRDLWASIQEAK